MGRVVIRTLYKPTTFNISVLFQVNLAAIHTSQKMDSFRLCVSHILKNTENMYEVSIFCCLAPQKLECHDLYLSLQEIPFLETQWAPALTIETG